MEKVLIQNAHVVDPSQGLDKVADLLIVDGKIADIGCPLPADGARVVDAKGLYCAPGLVDMHVHFRDPGFLQKEDILTGAAAAAAGGVTSVLTMPNTKPPASSPEVIAYMLKKAENAAVKLYPCAAITEEMGGRRLSDFVALQEAGAIAVSDDGKPVKNALLMQNAMEEAKHLGLTIISHCEDLDIIGKGIVNKGLASETLLTSGMDRSSEDSVTAREIALAAATGAAIHIAHISTRGSVALVRDAKARGVQVTAETAPHYFTLTEREVLGWDANYRMNPPLREEADRLAVLEGLRDGTLDAIATDHAPHTPAEKQNFFSAPNGVVGLETSFAVSYTMLVKGEERIFTLPQLIERMSLRPARILGIPAGTLKPGAAADLFLFDTESFAVDPERFCSKARNTPFVGRAFSGRVLATYLNGKCVYRRPGTGREL